MRIKLLNNLVGPWGGGFAGDLVTSPPAPAELIDELVRRGLAVVVTEVQPAGAPASKATMQLESKS